MTKDMFVKDLSVGLLSPDGNLVKTFFATKKDAVSFATKKLATTKARRSEADGRELAWKSLYRTGWRIVPVEHVPVVG